MSEYKCHNCESTHTTENMVATCAFCVAGYKHDISTLRATVERISSVIGDWPCECSTAAPVECSPCAIRAAISSKKD